jgi:hypothetical protein
MDIKPRDVKHSAYPEGQTFKLTGKEHFGVHPAQCFQEHKKAAFSPSDH